MPNCQHQKLEKKENPTLNLCRVHLPKILFHPFKATTCFGLLVLTIYIKGLFLEKRMHDLVDTVQTNIYNYTLWGRKKKGVQQTFPHSFLFKKEKNKRKKLVTSLVVFTHVWVKHQGSYTLKLFNSARFKFSCVGAAQYVILNGTIR